MYKFDLSTHKNEEVRVTSTGLRYWKQSIGDGRYCVKRVVTEDSSIFMERYSGNRDQAPTNLFAYKGFKIGFLFHKNPEQYLPNRVEVQENLGKSEGITTVKSTITAIGAPVWDFMSLVERDDQGYSVFRDDGLPKLDKTLSSPTAHTTGISWDEYNQGKRTKFPSESIRREMMEIWLPLASALMDDTMALSEKKSFQDVGLGHLIGALRHEVVFAEDILID